MSQYSVNPITNCLCNTNPVNNGIGEASGWRWA